MPLLSMTSVVTRALGRKPATRLYPHVEKKTYPTTRGHIRFIVNDCTFCALCSRVCPTDAIVCDRKSRTWMIDRRKCILCGACVEGCKKACLTCEQTAAPPFDAQTWWDLEHGTMSAEEVREDQAIGYCVVGPEPVKKERPARAERPARPERPARKNATDAKAEEQPTDDKPKGDEGATDGESPSA